MEKKILIVEDEEKIAKAYQNHLTQEGYEVAVACDGEEGLQKVGEFRPHLILLDIRMPVLDGISVLKKIKADEATKDIPVIMLTNFSDQENLVEAAKSGSILYAIKASTSLEKLTAWIRDLLQ